LPHVSRMVDALGSWLQCCVEQVFPLDGTLPVVLRPSMAWQALHAACIPGSLGHHSTASGQGLGFIRTLDKVTHVMAG
ncbi:Hypothetical predicted protein, partial [Marmota monax]